MRLYAPLLSHVCTSVAVFGPREAFAAPLYSTVFKSDNKSNQILTYEAIFFGYMHEAIHVAEYFYLTPNHRGHHDSL